MANRAYLYATETYETVGWHDWNSRNNDDEPYADSRWSLPFAWLFFFAPDDVTEYEKGGWSVLRLVAPKAVAVSRFTARLPTLLQMTANRHNSDSLVAAFLDAVESWHGEYLCLDADSVLEMGADESVPIALNVLQQIEAVPLNTANILSYAKLVGSVLSDAGYEKPNNAETFHTNLVGAWYFPAKRPLVRQGV